jgi:uncharacterized protein YlxW (UPF0749 family)
VSAPAPPGAGRRAADASMTLLKEVMERPLDPGYQAAADARADLPPTRRRRRAPLTVALSLVAGLVLVTGVVQLRAPRSDTAAGLREQVTARSEEVAAREQAILALTDEVAVLRDARLSGADDDLVEQVLALEAVTGARAVTGPGAVYTLDNSLAFKNPPPGDDRTPDEIAQGQVLDVDLQQVTNGLWAAGAEAISVNGHRLTATSAIRSAGEAILVDLRPLAPPYEVQAIGDPARMQTAFATSAAGRYLSSLEQNHGIQVTVQGADDLTVPAAGRLGLRYATPAGAQEQDAAPTTGGGTVPGSTPDQQPDQEEDP